MARSTGIVLMAGALAAGNEAVLAPMATHKPVDWGAVWRLVPVTAGLALAMAGVVVFPPAGGPSVIANANTVILGGGQTAANYNAAESAGARIAQQAG